MKTISVLFSALLIAAGVHADIYTGAIQQARRASDANNAEQQRIANQSGGNASGQPSTPATPPANPALQATLNNINSLQTDIKAVGSASGAPDASLKINLLNDLTSAAQGGKASSDSVKRLADDLLKAIVGKNQISAAQQTKLARDIHAIFNSSHLSSAQQQTMFDDVQKTLTDSGISLDSAVDVVTDLKNIATQTK